MCSQMTAIGPPMAIAPINRVREVLQYATRQIRPEKVMMGMALYGYDWRVPYESGALASAIDNNSAQDLAIREQVPIQWDDEAASPYFHYRNRDGEDHVVWFDDALSAAAKMQLVYDFNLRGISYWTLGRSFPQNWYLLKDSFNLKKWSAKGSGKSVG